MDDDEAVSGALDPVRPWTIKAMSAEARDMAIGAARRDNVTVGQWLERRIREWCAEGDDPQQPGTAVALARPMPPVANDQTATEVAQMVRLAMQLSALSPEARKDPLVGTARGTVRALLTKLRPG